MKPGAPDAAKAQPDAAPPPPDAAPVTVTSCADIVAANAGAPSGEYMIDPDGAGGADPFTVTCEMAVQGGGWTQVTDKLAASLSTSTKRQYLYLYGAVGYVSPCTTDAWTWTDNSGQELVGGYTRFDAAGTTNVACTGSAEKPEWGVGCSNGGGPYDKVLPIYVEAPATGLSELCVTGGCLTSATIFEKEGC
jgi:hypothetical protein